MLPFLTAAAVLVGALCLLNLVLTLGAVQRLREHVGAASVRAHSSRPLAADSRSWVRSRSSR
jgi:hypothetical protein